MNNIVKNIILLATISICTLWSCTNLDETVYDRLIAEKTKLTSEDLANVIAPAFTSFRDIYTGWDGLPDVYEESSDCIVIPLRWGIGWGDYYIAMHMHKWDPSISHIEGLWYNTFTAITYCNKAMYQLSTIEGIADKDLYMNELRALRAMEYYILLDNYRNVPVETEFNVPKGYLPSQKTGQEVYTFIESELNAVMPYLSENNDRSTYGRVNKWTAKMTLAKLYLNSGVYIGTTKWTEAMAQVNDVIASNKYKLAGDYLEPFRENNEGSVEQIFSIPLDQVYAGHAYYPYKTLNGASKATFNMGGAPWGGAGAIPQFIDTYDADDSRIKAFLGGPQLTYTGAALILPDGKQLNYLNYMSSVDSTGPYEGYRLVKYEIPMGLQDSPGGDIQFYRYTDALMIKAECLLRTGDATGAAAIVTTIRQRAFKSAPAKATVTGAQLQGGSTYKYGTYKNGVITKLEGGADIQYGRFLDELGWEFVGEHHRKQDLIRFNVYTTKSWFSHIPNGDYHKIYPIPLSQMETNSNLKQNPGY